MYYRLPPKIFSYCEFDDQSCPLLLATAPLPCTGHTNNISNISLATNVELWIFQLKERPLMNYKLHDTSLASNTKVDPLKTTIE